MRKLATLTAVALIWGSTGFAAGYANVIEQAFVQAGYSSVQVTKSRGQWLVSALMNGQTMRFVVDPTTGRSSRTNDDGPLHDLNDDPGQHGAGHDGGDDHGGDRNRSDDRGGDDHGDHGPNHD
jgi:hypothetical protein